MTEQLPRPIDPKDIRIDDRVRGFQSSNDCTVTVEFTVADRCVNRIMSPQSSWPLNEYTWTLLDRPEPPREVGGHWRDPRTGAEYIKTDAIEDSDHHYEHYRRYRGSGVSTLCLACDGDIVARLVLLDTP